jgi:hypothetical protein
VGTGEASAPSEEVKVCGRPEPPHSVVATIVDGTHAEVRWMPPATDNGAAVERYVVREVETGVVREVETGREKTVQAGMAATGAAAGTAEDGYCAPFIFDDLTAGYQCVHGPSVSRMKSQRASKHPLIDDCSCQRQCCTQH